MDLFELTKNELNRRFLDVNTCYIAMLDRPVKDYIDDPEFLKIRERLRQILNEFQRRRNETEID